ncbi:hypothetical protein [Actinophytocola sp.]|uniref:hypothetical protein n=1 Tax=Actinophytocola sp. TaxID=1872138 RepID=UPI002ED0938F
MDTATPTSRIRRNVLVGELRQMNLNPDHFVVFGSAPLLAHGLRASINDLDIVARADVWQCVSATGSPTRGMYSGDRVWQFYGGDLQFSERWITDDWDVDALIDNAEIIDGIRFATLADVLRYKEILGRQKDVADINALREYLGVHTCLSTSPWRPLTRKLMAFLRRAKDT